MIDYIFQLHFEVCRFLDLFELFFDVLMIITGVVTAYLGIHYILHKGEDHE